MLKKLCCSVGLGVLQDLYLKLLGNANGTVGLIYTCSGTSVSSIKTEIARFPIGFRLNTPLLRARVSKTVCHDIYIRYHIFASRLEQEKFV